MSLATVQLYLKLNGHKLIGHLVLMLDGGEVRSYAIILSHQYNFANLYVLTEPYVHTAPL